MKQQNYFETKVFTLKARNFKHAKGEGTNFFFNMQGDAPAEGETPTVWFSAVSFNQVIQEKKSYLMRGYLQVSPPYGERPAGLQLVVSEAILLGESQYVVRTKREGHNTSAGGMNSPSEQQKKAFKEQSPEFPDMEQSNHVPF